MGDSILTPLSALSLAETLESLRSVSGLRWRVGPFIVALRTNANALPPLLRRMYGDFTVMGAPAFADFQIALEAPRGLRAVVKPQVIFKLEGRTLFDPFPADTAFPLFEWGLNWCVGQRSHQYLLLHAAALERRGRALLLPAIPGSGKSTLCAALSQRGWRLLSDEFGMFDFRTRRIVPFPRPIALKNESIGVIRGFAPEAELGPMFPKTRKGTVAHLRPPRGAVLAMDRAVAPGWVVFPRFSAEAALALTPVPRSRAFHRLAHNSFNYAITGADGFTAIAEITRDTPCYDLTFGDLEQAIGGLEEITA